MDAKEQFRPTNEDLEQCLDLTLEVLGNALDLKDAETAGHCRRVTAFTIAVARAMQLPGDELRVIARGAFLHDIGKLAIPDLILRKPGALTEVEIGIMQEHCCRGHQLLRPIPWLTRSAEIVYAHHERWDGSGYPRGLKGEAIPLAARIVSVVNALDTITSDQPYRMAQPFAAACEEIVRWSGRQFDPKVVKVFLSIPESIWHNLRTEVMKPLMKPPQLA